LEARQRAQRGQIVIRHEQGPIFEAELHRLLERIKRQFRKPKTGLRTREVITMTGFAGFALNQTSDQHPHLGEVARSRHRGQL
jgi:GGDEF domain-containing protein